MRLEFAGQTIRRIFDESSQRGPMKFLTRGLCVVVLAGCAAEAPEGSFVQSETGLTVTPASGNSRRVRLEVKTDRIVRVTSVADGNLDLPASLMVVAASAPPAFKVAKREGEVVQIGRAHV